MCNEKETKVCPICNGKGLARVKKEVFCDNSHPKLCGIREDFDTCWACNGKGEIDPNEKVCDVCNGLGVVQNVGYPISNRNGKLRIKCPKCKGRGVI